MQKTLLTLTLVALLISACSPAISTDALPAITNTATNIPANTATSTSTIAPATSTSTATATSTDAPTATSTNTPTITPTQLPAVINAANASQIKELVRYGSPRIYKVAFSGDGKRIFAFTADGLKVYDESYNQVASMDAVYGIDGYGTSEPDSVSINYDGSWFALVAQPSPSANINSREYRVYDLAQGKIFAKPSPVNISRQWIAISQDGLLVAYPIEAEQRWVGRWQVANIATGEVKAEWHGSKGAFSADGGIFAAEVESQLYFWRTADWQQITNIGLGSPIGDGWRWSLSPNGDSVAIADLAHLNVWTVTSRSLVRSIEFSYKYTPDVLFAVGGQHVVIIGQMQNGQTETREWNITNGQPVESTSTYRDPLEARRKLESSQGFHSSSIQPVLGFSQGELVSVNIEWVRDAFGQYKQEYTVCYLIANSCSILYDVIGVTMSAKGDIFTAWRSDNGFVDIKRGIQSDGTLVQRITLDGQYMTLLGVSLNESFLVYSTYGTTGSSTVNLVDLTTGRRVSEYVVGALWENSGEISFSYDGSRLAVVPGVFGRQSDGVQLLVYDLSNGSTVLYRDYRKSYEHVYRGAFTLDDNFAFGFSIYGGGRDWQGIKIIDPVHHRTVGEHENFIGICIPMSYSPDGNLAACAGNGGEIMLVDGVSWKTISSWTAHSGEIVNIAFSPESRYIATSSDDGYVKVWYIP